MEFRVLGPLEVHADEAVRLGGPRPRALLGVLLVHAGQAVSAEHLIDQVWGERPPATATASLQMHVSALRKVLGARLVTTPSGYRLDATADEVDAPRFEAMVGQARDHLPERPASAAAGLAAALALWRGEPYAGVPAGSDVEAHRRRLAELRLAAQEDRLDAELAVGRHAHAVSELAGLVVEHPTRQRLAGLHLLALYRCGRTADAQAAYLRLCRAMDAELGAEPAAEVAALARAIDRRDPTLDPPSPVPRQPSRFVGRRHELERLADQLGRASLLTVTGPGGAGKTRLAMELARDTAADHPDGVHVVELASAQPGSSVAERVAAALSVQAGAGESALDALAGHLRGARALLVLDNCEHLVDDCGRVVADLLGHCAGLRILATSREPLGVAGERVWPLAGLAVPAAGDDPDVAARTEAVRLLADRGDAARPGFVVRRENASVAGELCRRLDGLPLAIELAAAQLRTLSLDEVATQIGRRLGGRLGLADRRARTAPDRHRTMRAAIDWSHDLLATDEREMFRRLSVFAGGCGAEAAERVTGQPHDVLERLVDRSVLVAEPHADGMRYRMLELVREYATERLLDAGNGELATGLRRRHAEWCAALAGQAVQAGAEHAAWMRRLAAEEPNLRAAVRWCLGVGGDAECALRIVAPLWWYWAPNGLAAEALGWLRQAMVEAERVPAPLRARTLRAAASLARHCGDPAEARTLGERSLATYRELGDAVAVAGALNGLCFTAFALRDFAEALRCAEEALAVAERAGDDLQTASALINKALSLRALDRSGGVVPMMVEARQRFRAIGERNGEAAALAGLAMMARRNGEVAECRQLALASLAAYREAGQVERQLALVNELAMVELAQGRPASALRLLAVTARERGRLRSPLVMTDEIAEEERCWADTRAALGDRAATVIASARTVSLRTVVADLLDGAGHATTP
ncbi:tetratricopeptide repeat protein [Solihabitans fulvus]|uniref:Tetratricopeptide repeat protein n=1 Tax=Solihabitans fulvus TaxID=1892852 RepID=A0A5B2WH16_9PSEU|nr:BTAD domain-containing putative transcriptional regulator [Solihabitans fulvus]KAA2250158.1 tetratricopeptide repeat protein [Solihabitans fulvus]